jgi:hypothetical protein
MRRRGLSRSMRRATRFTNGFSHPAAIPSMRRQGPKRPITRAARTGAGTTPPAPAPPQRDAFKLLISAMPVTAAPSPGVSSARSAFSFSAFQLFSFYPKWLSIRSNRG